LTNHGCLLRVWFAIGYGEANFWTCVPATIAYGSFNVTSHLSANDGPDEAHQALGFAQLSLADGLNNSQECIVNLSSKSYGPNWRHR
jgi:hypothetical protein